MCKATIHECRLGYWPGGCCRLSGGLKILNTTPPSGRPESDLSPLFLSATFRARLHHDKLLDKALEAVLRLPPDSQDEIARAMLNLAGGEGETEEIDPAHLPDVLESLA